MTPMYQKCAPAPLSMREIVRYAGGDIRDDALTARLTALLPIALPMIEYRISYLLLPISEDAAGVSLGGTYIPSKALKKALHGEKEVLVFMGTLGHAFDRLQEKYSRISPTDAYLLQAIGTERVEAMLDLFQAEFPKKTHRRVSAGYGDIPLSLQGTLVSLLDGGRLLGVTMTDSGLLYPKKTVTAFAAVKGAL